jgi:hypothetical protein
VKGIWGYLKGLYGFQGFAPYDLQNCERQPGAGGSLAHSQDRARTLVESLDERRISTDGPHDHHSDGQRQPSDGGLFGFAKLEVHNCVEDAIGAGSGTLLSAGKVHGIESVAGT